MFFAQGPCSRIHSPLARPAAGALESGDLQNRIRELEEKLDAREQVSVGFLETCGWAERWAFICGQVLMGVCLTMQERSRIQEYVQRLESSLQEAHQRLDEAALQNVSGSSDSQTSTS